MSVLKCWKTVKVWCSCDKKF